MPLFEDVIVPAEKERTFKRERRSASITLSIADDDVTVSLSAPREIILFTEKGEIDTRGPAPLDEAVNLGADEVNAIAPEFAAAVLNLIQVVDKIDFQQQSDKKGKGP